MMTPWLDKGQPRDAPQVQWRRTEDMDAHGGCAARDGHREQQHQGEEQRLQHRGNPMFRVARGHKETSRQRPSLEYVTLAMVLGSPDTT